MAKLFSIDDDYQIFDDLISIKYTSTRKTGSMIDMIASAVLRRSVSTKEVLASQGVYESSDVNFLIPAKLLKIGPPKPADVITDSDGDWTVLTVSSILDSDWRLATRNLAIHNDLQDKIDIQRPSLFYDLAGAPVKSWPTDSSNPGGIILYPSLACRVQPLEATISEERGIRGLIRKFQIIVSKPVPDITNEDRVWWRDVKTGQFAAMEIRGYHDFEHIGDLPSIDAEIAV